MTIFIVRNETSRQFLTKRVYSGRIRGVWGTRARAVSFFTRAQAQSCASNLNFRRPDGYSAYFAKVQPVYFRLAKVEPGVQPFSRGGLTNKVRFAPPSRADKVSGSAVHDRGRQLNVKSHSLLSTLKSFVAEKTATSKSKSTNNWYEYFCDDSNFENSKLKDSRPSKSLVKHTDSLPRPRAERTDWDWWMRPLGSRD